MAKRIQLVIFGKNCQPKTISSIYHFTLAPTKTCTSFCWTPATKNPQDMNFVSLIYPLELIALYSCQRNNQVWIPIIARPNGIDIGTSDNTKSHIRSGMNGDNLIMNDVKIPSSVDIIGYTLRLSRNKTLSATFTGESQPFISYQLDDTVDINYVGFA